MRDRQEPGKDSTSRHERPRRAAPAPESGTAAHLLHLQRTLGNAAVARMVEGAQGEDEVQRSAVHGVLSSSGQPLGAPVREEMESRMGADFSDVRVHTGGTAQRSAAEIGARAYTSGNHVVLGSGASDKHTLAHELTHVLQQRSGPVAGTDNGDGLKVSDPSDRYERAAEANAKRVMAKSVQRACSCSDSSPGRCDDDGYEVHESASAQALQRVAGTDAVSHPVMDRAYVGASLTTVQRGVNLAQVILEEQDDKKFLQELVSRGEDLINSGDDAGYARIIRRFEAIKVEDRNLFPRANRAIADLHKIAGGGGPSVEEGYKKAEGSFDNVEPKKRKKPDESRSVYLGAGDLIDSTKEASDSSEKKSRREERILELPNGEWSWEANERWVRAAMRKFDRFKLIANEVPDWVRAMLLRPGVTGDEFLREVHGRYKDKEDEIDEDTLEIKEKDRKSPENPKEGKNKNDFYRTVQHDNRFTYFSYELAILLDGGYRLQEDGGKLIMKRG